MDFVCQAASLSLFRIRLNLVMPYLNEKCKSVLKVEASFVTYSTRGGPRGTEPYGVVGAGTSQACESKCHGSTKDNYG